MLKEGHPPFIQISKLYKRQFYTNCHFILKNSIFKFSNYTNANLYKKSIKKNMVFLYIEQIYTKRVLYRIFCSIKWKSHPNPILYTYFVYRFSVCIKCNLHHKPIQYHYFMYRNYVYI